MLEACPEGSNLCRVRGGSFCVTHEGNDPHVLRALKAGAQVYEVGTGRPLRNLDDADTEFKAGPGAPPKKAYRTKARIRNFEEVGQRG